MTRRPRPYPSPRRRPAAFRPHRLRSAARIHPKLFWAAAIVLLGGGTGTVAPVLDDYRSSLRPMTAGCRVDYVIDGDTVDLACAGRGTVRARITGYDSPELHSSRCPAERAAAEEARQALEAMARGVQPTEVAFLGTDKYGRALVDMRLGGRRVATAMVEAGHARRYLGAARGGWC